LSHVRLIFCLDITVLYIIFLGFEISIFASKQKGFSRRFHRKKFVRGKNKNKNQYFTS
jgi:hypothetical protein